MKTCNIALHETVSVAAVNFVYIHNLLDFVSIVLTMELVYTVSRKQVYLSLDWQLDR